MTRLVSVLISLLNFVGLIACCCNPMPIVPPPQVFNPPPQPVIDPPRFVPPPQQVRIPDPVEPPPIGNNNNNNLDRPTIYANDPRFTFLDLANKGNIGRLEGTFFPDNHLGGLASGVQVMGDIPFRVQDRYMVLRGGKSIQNIGVSSMVRKLHVCHAAHNRGNAKNPNPIAFYVLRYTDNTNAQFPIYYGRHIINWWSNGKEPAPPDSTMAWRGNNNPAARAGNELILYRTSFDNPHPAKTVQSVDYLLGVGAGADPFCVALTVEK